MVKPNRPGVRRALLTAGVLAALAPAGVAHADTDVTVTGSGAAATITSPSFGASFTGVTLDGTRKTTSTSVGDWSVTDARGTGQGWQVKVSATTPSTGGGTPHTMPNATLVLGAPTAAADDALMDPSGAPATAGGDILAGAVTVADAESGEGMGKWDFTQGASDLTLTVPPDVYAGTYTTTLTVDLIGEEL
jgi:hypothetical protein